MCGIQSQLIYLFKMRTCLFSKALNNTANFIIILRCFKLQVVGTGK
ncbi:hypothetical protein ACVWWU_002210 [Pantoea sp. PA1]|jgi:hypothetical protein|nr:hypothetical protein C7427_103560 [Pantoea ananatis]